MPTSALCYRYSIWRCRRGEQCSTVQHSLLWTMPGVSCPGMAFSRNFLEQKSWGQRQEQFWLLLHHTGETCRRVCEGKWDTQLQQNCPGSHQTYPAHGLVTPAQLKRGQGHPEKRQTPSGHQMQPKKLPQMEEGMTLGVNSSKANPCYSETSRNDFLLSWCTDTEVSLKKSLKRCCRALQKGLKMKIKLKPKYF